MYGKIENNNLILAPQTISVADTVYYNPTDDIYIEQGYLPIVTTPYPNDGKEYIETWQESDGSIVCTWTEVEQPEAIGMTTEERLCQAETELNSLKAENERLMADVMYLCMMNDIEPTEA